MWQVLLHPAVEEWFLALCREDPVSADRISEAVDLLAEHGPGLGRPLVDRVKGSAYHHMKELRPGSSGSSEIRVLFAFDRRREAVLLVGGDKAGAWASWYRVAVPIADERYALHLKTLEEQA